MNLQTRLGLNLFLFTLVGLVFVIYMFKTRYSLSDVSKIMKKQIPKYAPEDALLIPLNEIVRSPATVSQDNPAFIRFIRNKYLVAPTALPYNLSQNKKDPSYGQSSIIREILKNKRNGFFIECGAYDGEFLSNSLEFEKEMGWRGVLIEADPNNFALVRKKNRKAWLVPACLSIHKYPNVVMFGQGGTGGKISDVTVGSKKIKRGIVEVQCLPIYSILLALNTTTVDFFSLDVEGHELEVLKTIPWDKVKIITLAVEYAHGKQSKDVMRKYMEGLGYKVHSEFPPPISSAYDFIFYHPLLLNKSITV